MSTEQEAPQSGKAARTVSSIAFPYFDLEDAETLAQAIHENYGTTCATDQLAAALGHETTNSGSFRGRMSAARMFGLIETRRGEVDLTHLGGQVVDPRTQPRARVVAFLNVPLYSQLYEEFRGRTLPADPGLESHMVSLGVTPKQADKARQAFQRSAQWAGFFHAGKDRLVEPPGSKTSVPPQEREAAPASEVETANQGPVVAGGGFEHGSPLIVGLFQQLPAPGSPFANEDQEQWLTLAKHILRTVYPIRQTSQPVSEDLSTPDDQGRSRTDIE